MTVSLTMVLIVPQPIDCIVDNGLYSVHNPMTVSLSWKSVTRRKLLFSLLFYTAFKASFVVVRLVKVIFAFKLTLLKDQMSQTTLHTALNYFWHAHLHRIHTKRRSCFWHCHFIKTTTIVQENDLLYFRQTYECRKEQSAVVFVYIVVLVFVFVFLRGRGGGYFVAIVSLSTIVIARIHHDYYWIWLYLDSPRDKCLSVSPSSR